MRAAVYIRKSREDKNKANVRLDAQRRLLPEEAKRRGWTIVALEDDGYLSGRDQAKLPGLQRIVAKIKGRGVDVVLAIELTRFSRDETAIQGLEFVELCRKNSVQLATPGQVLDPCQHMEWLLLHMSNGMSAVEMRQIGQRMKEG